MPSKGALRRKHSRDSLARLRARGVDQKTGVGARPRWTKAEVDLITADEINVVALSKQLDRTVDAIYCKRAKVLRGQTQGSEDL